ncbi:MAG: DNA repair protein RadA [Nocardioidaceae bacterium]
MTKTATKRPASPYRCVECGWASMKWVGRCGECQIWGSVEEFGAAKVAQMTPGAVTTPAVPVAHVQPVATTSSSSGLSELDRVLGGGLVPGSVLLLAGEPGVGKSTLLLEVAASSARRGQTILYVSGEESAAQIRLRAERIGALEDKLYLAAEIDLAAVLSHIDAVSPDLLIIDSIQTIASTDIEGAAGGVTQVRAVTAALVRLAKERHLPTLLVGHVTKDGAIAGPRALEHIVDVVLHFEGERNSRLRILRAIKNRFGKVDEIGCFEFAEQGIVEITDPSGLFVSQHSAPIPGTCVTVTLEGRRPLIAEVQALVGTPAGQQPRRAVSGLDAARLAMLVAVLQRRVGLQLGQHDIYAASVGGASLRSPGADVAVAIALTSAALNILVPKGTIAIGEVGLAGELRRVPDLAQRLSEAARLGFTRAIVPSDHAGSRAQSARAESMSIVECDDLSSALSVLRLVKRPADHRPPQLYVVG